MIRRKLQIAQTRQERQGRTGHIAGAAVTLSMTCGGQRDRTTRAEIHAVTRRRRTGGNGRRSHWGTGAGDNNQKGGAGKTPGHETENENEYKIKQKAEYGERKGIAP